MTYRKMEKKDFKQCALLSAEAFCGYEFFTNYFEDEKKRFEFLKRVNLCELKANAKRMHSFVCEEDGRIIACATLFDEDFKKPSDMAYLLNGWLSCVRAGGSEDVNAWNEMNSKNDAPCHSVKNAWYLSSFTVLPAYQGRGVGSDMINNCLIPYIKENGGRALTLVTNSAVNKRFYEKNGFTVFDEAEFEYKGKKTPAWSFKMEL